MDDPDKILSNMSIECREVEVAAYGPIILQFWPSDTVVVHANRSIILASRNRSTKGKV